MSPAGATAACSADDDRTAELADLLRGCAQGQKAALAAFYRVTAPAVFARLRVLVASRHVAEEVLQDTYVQVWRYAASFDPALGSPLAWLHAIARYRALAVLRRQRREMPAGDAALLAEL